MRKLAILTFMTLDGVMQSPTSPDEDPSGNFRHGGWAAPYWDEVMQQVVPEAMSEPYDLLLGRSTYELFAAHWPNAGEDNPLADKINNATKFVVSSAPEKPAWQNSIPLSGNAVAEITDLKNEDGPLLQVHGSSQLIQLLLAHDLIDEFRLWVFPVITGPGKTVFGDHSVPASLQLVRTATTESGVQMLIYKRRTT